MTPGIPSFILRSARVRDRRAILQLARELDSINLPVSAAEMGELLERSERSFRGEIPDRSRAVYVFCAEEIATRRIVAASLIIGKHGTPQAPHYYLEIDSDERYSHTLRRMFRHTYLRLRYSMNGPTEIGGLIVAPAMRGHAERIGKQISWVRFMYIARHRRRFEPELIAEMLPPLHSDHGNTFWDHYGRVVTGLSFREADHLSTHDKEFIRALFPESPLYTFLLPEDVRNSIGAVGEQTRGAVHLLRQAGMHFLDQIDPFDGGPYYGGKIDELKPICECRSLRAFCDSPDKKSSDVLAGYEDAARGFRAVRTGAVIDGDKLMIEPAVLKLLGAAEKTRLAVVPVP
ncbi:MAG: arginine N-succinyltransferase [Candidatus Binataceae bacterium]